jgi:hypothetical protein
MRQRRKKWHSQTGHRLQYNTIRRMCFGSWITKATGTLKMFNIYCFSTAIQCYVIRTLPVLLPCNMRNEGENPFSPT